MKLSEFLKKQRINLSLSQQDIAKEIGISYVIYNRYETGLRKPSYKVTKRLAEYFKLEIIDVVRMEQEEYEINK